MKQAHKKAHNEIYNDNINADEANNEFALVFEETPRVNYCITRRGRNNINNQGIINLLAVYSKHSIDETGHKRPALKLASTQHSSSKYSTNAEAAVEEGLLTVCSRRWWQELPLPQQRQ